MKKITRFLTMSAIGLGLGISLSFGSSPAQAAEYPNVTTLKAFSAEANYMSLPGYLRDLVWQRDGIWMTREESVAIVQRQIATGE